MLAAGLGIEAVAVGAPGFAGLDLIVFGVQADLIDGLQSVPCEVLLMDQLDALAEVLEHFHRIVTGAHGPEGVQFQTHILGIGVFHHDVQDALAVESTVFLGVVVVEHLHAALFPEDLGAFIIELALSHQLIIGGEAVVGVDDVLVAQNGVVLDDLMQVGLLIGEDVSGDHAGAIFVKLGLHILGGQAEAAAEVLDGVVVADLDVLVTQLGNCFHSAQSVLGHQIADGVKNQTDFNHGETLLFHSCV